MLDEIQRLVPGYDVSRLGLLSGNDQQTRLVNIQPAGIQSHPEWIVPSRDELFTSGTLSRYLNTLNSVIENKSKARVDTEVVAD